MTRSQTRALKRPLSSGHLTSRPTKQARTSSGDRTGPAASQMIFSESRPLTPPQVALRKTAGWTSPDANELRTALSSTNTGSLNARHFSKFIFLSLLGC